MYIGGGISIIILCDTVAAPSALPLVEAYIAPYLITSVGNSCQALWHTGTEGLLPLVETNRK